MTYSFADLEDLWTRAGGPAALAPIMAAIALAESSGNPNATNPTDNGGTQTSWGLWQISDGTHNAPDPNWSDPAVNAELAVQKYYAQGLGAWGTYTNGAYRNFLDGAASTTPPAVVNQAATTSGSWLSPVSFAPRDLSKTTTSMLVVVVGGLLLLVTLGAMHKRSAA